MSAELRECIGARRGFAPHQPEAARRLGLAEATQHDAIAGVDLDRGGALRQQRRAEPARDRRLTATISTDPGRSFRELSDRDDAGRWKVFFFYPKDFTFVCPTEIAGFAALAPEFEKRGAVVYGGSTDSEFVHRAWCEHEPLLRDLPIPLLADVRRDLSQTLGILDRDEGVCLRATFVVDPDGIIRFAAANDLSVGRNPHEVLRVLDALRSGGLTACGWRAGDPNLEAA